MGLSGPALRPPPRDDRPHGGCADEFRGQGVIAGLKVKPKLVSECGRGEKKPSGPSLKPLSIVNARGLEAII